MSWIGGAVAGLGSIAGSIIQSSAQRAATRESRRQFDEAMRRQREQSLQARGYISSALPGARNDLTQGQQQGQSTLQAQNEYLKGVYGDSMALGSRAENRLADVVLNGDMSHFYNSPDYTYRQQEGELGISRAAAMGGTVGAGSHLKDFARFNQGLASQGYQQYLGNVGSLASMGQQARGQYSQLQNANVGNIANSQVGLGQGLSSLGMNSSLAMANAAMNQSHPGMEMQGVQMAGQGPIAQGNIWGNLAQNLGNIAGSYFQTRHDDAQLNKILEAQRGNMGYGGYGGYGGGYNGQGFQLRAPFSGGG